MVKKYTANVCRVWVSCDLTHEITAALRDQWTLSDTLFIIKHAIWMVTRDSHTTLKCFEIWRSAASILVDRQHTLYEILQGSLCLNRGRTPNIRLKKGVNPATWTTQGRGGGVYSFIYCVKVLLACIFLVFELLESLIIIDTIFSFYLYFFQT